MGPNLAKRPASGPGSAAKRPAAGAGSPVPLWSGLADGPRGPCDVPVPLAELERIEPGRPHSSEESPELIPHLLRASGADSERPGLIVVLPGGGMMFRSGREAENVCRWVNSLGLHAALLHYRVQRRFPAAFLDARRALQIVRANADAWGVNTERVGVMGFSAGGHSAAMLASAWDYPPELGSEGPCADEAAGAASRDARPDCAILCYPVITGSGDPAGAVSANDPFVRVGARQPGDPRPCRHHGSCQVLLGEEPWSEADVARISAERWVRAAPAPPPTFLWHAAADVTVPSLNPLRFASALAAVAAPYELHVFQEGGHGLSLGEDREPCRAVAWKDLCETWLRSLGWLGRQ